MPVPSHLRLSECTACHAEWHTPKEAKQLAMALRKTYPKAKRALVDASLFRLSEEHVRRIDVEAAADLSAGYVSRLTSGKKDPNGPLTTLLLMFSRAPELVGWAESLWTLPDSSAEDALPGNMASERLAIAVAGTRGAALSGAADPAPAPRRLYCVSGSFENLAPNECSGNSGDVRMVAHGG
jgi:hypothetical protein